MAKAWTEAAIMREQKPGKHALGGNLYLRIQGASKIYSFRYMKHGKSHERSLGPVHKIRLNEARALAAQYSSDIFHGRSIGQGKKTGVTFEHVAREAMPHLTATLCKDSKREWASTLLKVAAPHFGKAPVNSITPKDVADLLSKFWVTQPEKADRLKARLARTFEWGIQAGLSDADNPANRDAIRALLGRVKRARGHHEALPFEQLPALFKQLTARSEPEAIALQLCFHTAARSAEILRAVWSEFDLDAGLWNIPKERMKARRPHTVVLSEPALELLEAMPNKDGRLFKLYTHRMLWLLRELTGNDALTVHGTVRAGFRDWGDSQDVSDRIIEDALAHLDSNAVRRAYRRNERLEKRRAVMEYWSGFLLGKEFISEDEACRRATMPDFLRATAGV